MADLYAELFLPCAGSVLEEHGGWNGDTTVVRLSHLQLHTYKAPRSPIYVLPYRLWQPYTYFVSLSRVFLLHFSATVLICIQTKTMACVHARWNAAGSRSDLSHLNLAVYPRLLLQRVSSLTAHKAHLDTFTQALKHNE